MNKVPSPRPHRVSSEPVLRPKHRKMWPKRKTKIKYRKKEIRVFWNWETQVDSMKVMFPKSKHVENFALHMSSCS